MHLPTMKLLHLASSMCLDNSLPLSTARIIEFQFEVLMICLIQYLSDALLASGGRCCQEKLERQITFITKEEMNS